MTATYNIEGINCGACVAKIKSAFADITGSDVTLKPPQLILPSAMDIDDVSKRLANAGKYKIASGNAFAAWLKVYKPLFLIIGYISVVSLAGAENWHAWMIHFMAGFFLVFSFFKFLDLRGFADAYAGYDILAARMPVYGFIYPFIELFLGIAFLFSIALKPVLVFTIILMSFSAIGVIRAVASKKKIRCACLGTALNLPMSTVTIVEDLGMVAMSILMLAAY